ncbi:MAG: hypothetical protein KC425_18485, partial [Anaerolineales bacterium]|nr:hypothetical protein [Anaerolineales bacterium]
MKTFQTLDAAVREAEKSLRESERLAHLLTRVERDMARQQAALSRAATALKWKTADLRQTEGFSLEAVYQRLRGRQKEWREDVRQAHAAALAQYAQSREKLASLEAERDALSAQLAALADAPQQVEAVRRRQAAFLMARGGEVGELTAVFDRLEAVRAELGQLVPVLAAGRQAMAQLA